MKAVKERKKHVCLAVFLGVIVGIIGAFAKWGWEVPFPPRNPTVFFPVDALSRVTPPQVWLEQLGLNTDLTYVFSGVVQPLSIFIVHVGFSVVFGILYCVLVEYFPRVKMWQGTVFGFVVYILAHVVVMPLMGLTPPLSELPFDEHVSELFGHVFWMWVMELVRHDLKYRIIKSPNRDD